MTLRGEKSGVEFDTFDERSDVAADDVGGDGLQALGCDVSYCPDAKDESLIEAITRESPDVLVVRGTKVTEPMLAASQIKLVVRAGAGYNTIDVAAASRRGIYVSNCPGKNSNSNWNAQPSGNKKTKSCRALKESGL